MKIRFDHSTGGRRPPRRSADDAAHNGHRRDSVACRPPSNRGPTKRRFLVQMPAPCDGCESGAEGSRTPDLLNAIQALSQLSYDPNRIVPDRGFDPFSFDPSERKTRQISLKTSSEPIRCQDFRNPPSSGSHDSRHIHRFVAAARSRSTRPKHADVTNSLRCSRPFRRSNLSRLFYDGAVANDAEPNSISPSLQPS